MTADPDASKPRDENEDAAVATEETTPRPAPRTKEPSDDPGFDMVAVENPSFAMLEEGRAHVFANQARVASFRSKVRALQDSGEEGRRKGLGLWMLGDHAAAERQLAAYGDDDVASYTRAQALVALRRFEDARPIFERLSNAYPEEPRPRAGLIQAALEAGLSARPDAADEVADEAERAIEAAPQSFRESAEGRFVQGLVAEARRDYELALDHYAAARELDPTHRQNLLHGASLAERFGLDDLAVRWYEELVELRPAERRVLVNLGVLYEDLGRHQEAASCYDVLVRNDPADPRARLYLADARAGMQMYYDEDLERKEDRLNQILRIPITDFELSVRARNCLNKMDIQTLGDLVMKTEQELLAYKNFGETSLHEIKEILHSKGLRLGMPREEAVASIEAHTLRPRASDPADVMNKPVMELQLSIRARRAVEALGCLTAGDVTKHSAEEYLSMPNFGQTSLQELRNVLTEIGLKLKGE